MKRLLLTIATLILMCGCSNATYGEGTYSMAGTPPELPPDQLVFQVHTYPGYAPQIYYLTSVPWLSVYGDGTVITTDFSSDGAPIYNVGKTTPDAVAEFAYLAGHSKIIKESVDFGVPQITDMGDTTVLLHDTDGKNSISVYAYNEDIGLTKKQRDNRKRLHELVDQAASLTPTTATDPERVEVREFDTAIEDGTPWPGPDPTTFLKPQTTSNSVIACGMLSGADAKTVYDAALDNDSMTWLVNSVPRGFAVVPLLPGEVPCQ